MQMLTSLTLILHFYVSILKKNDHLSNLKISALIQKESTERYRAVLEAGIFQCDLFELKFDWKLAMHANFLLLSKKSTIIEGKSLTIGMMITNLSEWGKNMWSSLNNLQIDTDDAYNGS